MTFNHQDPGSSPVVLKNKIIKGLIILFLYILLYTLPYLLLSCGITHRRDKSILYSRVTICLFLYSIIQNSFSLFFLETNKGIGLYSGLFNITSNNTYFHLFILLLSILILSLTSFHPWKHINSIGINIFNSLELNKYGEQFKIIEYSLIILFIIIGSIFLISSNDIISIFLSIELQSYGLYILSTLYRNSELATSGGLTYFLLGSLSSCFILLGLSLLYANSGITNLDGLYIITSISEIINDSNISDLIWYKPYYIHFSLLIMSIGFLFKVSAAPFHFWAPDVYDAIPTIVTTFVSIIAKISILIFFLELIHYTSSCLFNFNLSWSLNLLISSFLSLIIGTIVGLTQNRIKRLYTYSTISHLGFILLSLSIYSIESIQAFIFYLMQYSISNLNAFIILITIGYSLYFYTNNNIQYVNLLDKNNSPIQLISQIKGYFYINPILALSLAITLFSFAGIPPLIGFFAKQMVLSAAINNGYIFMSLVAIITSVISAVYYLAIIKQMFFDNTDYKIKEKEIETKLFKKLIENKTTNTVKTKNEKENILSWTEDIISKGYDNVRVRDQHIKLSSSLTIIISILTYIILLFILLPNEWLNVASILSIMLFKNV